MPRLRLEGHASINHNHYSISNQQQLDCLFNHLLRLSRMKISTCCITRFHGTGDWSSYLLFHCYGPISQILQCIGQIFYNVLFCNRNVHTCSHFCYNMVHCGIWAWWIVWFVKLTYYKSAMRTCFCLLMLCKLTLVPWEFVFIFKPDLNQHSKCHDNSPDLISCLEKWCLTKEKWFINYIIKQTFWAKKNYQQNTSEVVFIKSFIECC